jgi:hypothetical protein
MGSHDPVLMERVPHQWKSAHNVAQAECLRYAGARDVAVFCGPPRRVEIAQCTKL